MTPADIARLRTLHLAASPAPWIDLAPDGYDGVVAHGRPPRHYNVCVEAADRDLGLIVAMRNALLALLDEIERLRRIVRGLAFQHFPSGARLCRWCVARAGGGTPDFAHVPGC